MSSVYIYIYIYIYIFFFDLGFFSYNISYELLAFYFQVLPYLYFFFRGGTFTFFSHFSVRFKFCFLYRQSILVLRVVLEIRESLGNLCNILALCNFLMTPLNQIVAKLMFLADILLISSLLCEPNRKNYSVPQSKPKM